MAISPDLPGVTVAITIKDQKLPEQDFPDPDPETRTVNRLVEAQSDQIFEVQMTVDTNTDFKGSELSFKVYVDGKSIDDVLISRDILNIGSAFTETSQGLFTSSNMVRKYQFADIANIENHSTSISSRSESVRVSSTRASASTSVSESLVPFRGQPSGSSAVMPIPRPSYTGAPLADSILPHHQASELGTIKVVVRHRNRNEKVSFNGREESSYISSRQRQEAKKKHVTQHVRFLAPEKTTAVQYWSATNVPDVPNPAATFIFHYRSKEGLESMLALLAEDQVVVASSSAGTSSAAVLTPVGTGGTDTGHPNRLESVSEEEWDMVSPQNTQPEPLPMERSKTVRRVPQKEE